MTTHAGRHVQLGADPGPGPALTGPHANGTAARGGAFPVGPPCRVEARASFRDFDGRRRLVARYRQSHAEAERRLREALRDRSGTTTSPVSTLHGRSYGLLTSRYLKSL